MKQRKDQLILIGLVLFTLLISVGLYTYSEKSLERISKIQTSSIIKPEVVQETNNEAFENNPSTHSVDLIMCGDISYDILDYDYSPTEAERFRIIKSLSCINSAIVTCSPAVFVVDKDNNSVRLVIKGRVEGECTVEMQRNNESKISCPLPNAYLTERESRFAIKSYDQTIVFNLITDIWTEVSPENENDYCKVY